MEIITLGGTKRLMSCAAALSGAEDTAGTHRLVILPIPTTRDKKTINSTSLPLEEILSFVSDGTLVAGYGIPEEIGKKITDKGGVIYDCSFDEGFLVENANLTALGAVGRIMTTERLAIDSLSIGILGYGRIGKRLLELLLYLGAKATVFTGRESVALELCSAGVNSSTVDRMDLSGLNILINTAPSPFPIDESELPRELVIIDLASGNYMEGITRVTKMPSVPEMMYPESAGRLYAEYIKSHL